MLRNSSKKGLLVPYVPCCCEQLGIFPVLYTAISIKVVHEQSGKVEYER